MYNISPTDSDNLTYVPICIPLNSYYCLTALASTSSTMLRRNGDSGKPCLIPDFDGDGVGCGFFMYTIFIMLRMYPPVLLPRIFILKIYWIL